MRTDFTFLFSERSQKKLRNLRNPAEVRRLADGIAHGFATGCPALGLGMKKLKGSGQAIYEARLNDGVRILFRLCQSFVGEAGEGATAVAFLDVAEHDQVTRFSRNRQETETPLREQHVLESFEQIEVDDLLEHLLQVGQGAEKHDDLLDGERWFAFQDVAQLNAWAEGQGELFLKLTEEQWALTSPSLRTPAFIYGGPGSGKTTVMLYRIYRIADPSETLFVTLSNTLLDEAKRIFHSIPGADALFERVTFVAPQEVESLKKQTFRHIFVDESQDLEPELFAQVLNKLHEGGDLLFSADPHQNIRGSAFRVDSAWHLIEERFHRAPFSHSLCQNLRNTATIHELALGFLSTHPDALADEHRGVVAMSSPLVGMPCAFCRRADDVSFAELNQVLTSILSVHLSAAVIVSDWRRKNALASELNQPKLVLTVEEAKGLEFDAVLVWDLFSGKLDGIDVRRAYVAITRAHRYLYLCGNQELEPSERLQARPILTWAASVVADVHFQNVGPEHHLPILYETPRDAEWAVIEAYEAAGYSGGEAYARLGLLDEALNHYLKAGEFALAGELLLRTNQNSRAAEAFEKAGDFAKAAELFESCEMLSKAVDCYFQARDFEKAAPLYQKLGRRAEALESYRRIGLPESEARLRVGQTVDAAEAFLHEGDPLQAAELYFSVGQIKAALNAYKIAGLSPAMSFVRVGQLEKAAVAYLQAGDFEQAAQTFEQYANSLNSSTSRRVFEEALNQSAELYKKLERFDKVGELYERMERFSEAALAFRGANLLERAASSSMKAHQYEAAASLYTALGQHEQAASAYQRLGDNARAFESLQLAGLSAGDAHLRLNEVLSAIDDYIAEDRVLDAAKLCIRAKKHERAAKLFCEIGRYDDAFALYLGEGLKVEAAECAMQAGQSQRAAELWLELDRPLEAAQIFFNAGRYERAGDIYEQAEAHEQAIASYLKAQALDKAAEIYRNLGELDQAAAMYCDYARYEQAAKLYLECNKVSEAAELLLRCGRSDAAAKLYMDAGENEKAAELYLKNGYLEKAAELFLKQGQVEKAAECYLQANSCTKAAELYLKLGRDSDAAHAYEKGRLYEKAMTLCLKLGHFEKAAELAIKLKALSKAANYFMQAGCWRKAAELFRRLKFYQPLATCYQKMGNFLAAADALMAAQQPEAAYECYLRHGLDDARAREKAGLEPKVPSSEELVEKAERDENRQQLLQEADRLVAEGQLDEATTLFEQAGLSGSKLLLRLKRFQEAGDLLLFDGNYRQAGAAYQEGGLYEQAAKAYIMGNHLHPAAEAFALGGHTIEAAKILESVHLPDRAAECYLQAGLIAEAANVYLYANQLERALKLLVSHGEIERARALCIEVGQPNRADRLLENSSPPDAEPEEPSEPEGLAPTGAAVHRREAELKAKAGYFRAAAEAYARAGMFAEAQEMHKRAAQESRTTSVLPAPVEPTEESEPNATELEMAYEFFAARQFGDAAYHYLLAGRTRRAIHAWRVETCERIGRVLLEREQFSKAARMFMSAGSFHEAGECYASAQMPLRAAEAFACARDFNRAAQAYEAAGQSKRAAAARLLERSEEKLQNALPEEAYIDDKAAMGILRTVALCCAQAEFYEQSADNYARIGEFSQAFEHYRRADLVERSAAVRGFATGEQYAAKQARRVEAIAAKDEDLEPRKRAERLFTEGEFTKAAELFLEFNNYKRAAQAYVAANDVSKAVEAYRKGKFFKQAAQLCVKSHLFDRAAELYAEAGQFGMAEEMRHRDHQFFATTTFGKFRMDEAGEESERPSLVTDPDLPRRVFCEEDQRNPTVPGLMKVCDALAKDLTRYVFVMQHGDINSQIREAYGVENELRIGQRRKANMQIKLPKRTKKK